jgi:hypothetical protein
MGVKDDGSRIYFYRVEVKNEFSDALFCWMLLFHLI